MSNPKREAALAALREAVKARLAYWDAMDVVEAAFGFDAIDIPDKVSNEMVSQVENLASGVPSTASTGGVTVDDVEWIGEQILDEFMASCGVSL